MMVLIDQANKLVQGPLVVHVEPEVGKYRRVPRVGKYTVPSAVMVWLKKFTSAWSDETTGNNIREGF